MFELTGDIDAYLLYRAFEQTDSETNEEGLAADVGYVDESELPPS